MKIIKALMMALPFATVAFAAGCSDDSVKPVPTCNDGVKNQDETDKDCGGLTCPGCKMDKVCQTNADCLVGICDGGQCLGGNEPLNAAQLCALYYATYQNTRDGDGGLYTSGSPGAVCTQAPIFDARKFDTELVAYVCRPGTTGYKWGEALVTAVSEGRVAIDWTLAKNCLERSREMRSTRAGVDVVASPEWLTLKLGICKSFYEGTKGEGVACKEDWDCLGDMGCYTKTPTVAGSRVCMTGGSSRDACTEWRPCAPGYFCSEGSCAPLGGLGDDCYYPSDCESGACGEDGTCAAAPAKGIGEDCEEYEPESGYSVECNIPSCGSCRPTAAGARTTCQLYGKEGEYCRTWMDCAYDLGCVNHVCAFSPVGALCGPGVEGMCAPGAVCIPPATCETYTDDSSCEADSFCYWDAEYEACAADTGTCVGETQLPETGACYGPGVCASRAFCNNENVCVLLGTEGATCDDLHPCNEDLGFICANDRCTFACEMKADCPAGQYCDDSGNVPVCTAMNESACDPYVDGCPDSKFCDVPGMWCGWYAQQTTCVADTECAWTVGTCTANDEGPCPQKTTDVTCAADTANQCAWQPTPNLCIEPACEAADATACGALSNCTWLAAVGSQPAGCYPKCWQFDGNQAGCSGAGCYWLADYAWCFAPCGLEANQNATACGALVASFSCQFEPMSCQTRYDCTQHNGNDAACDGAANCMIDVASSCDPVAGLSDTGVCATKLAVGEDTIPDLGFGDNDTSALCQSGYSTAGVGEFYVCTEPPSASGCVANETVKMFLNLNFLFGGVLFLSRLRRRRV